MKKHLYFLLSILISHNALSVDRTWVGTTKERARTTSWSSSGIPDTDDTLNIDNPTPTIAPVISGGTDAHALRVYVRGVASALFQ